MLCGYAMKFDIIIYKQQHEIWVCLHHGVYHGIPKFMAMGATQFSDKPVFHRSETTQVDFKLGGFSP